MSDSENHLFYGRSEELKHLFKAWTSASDGEPQWVTLVAESGTGKTRLLHEFYRCISDLEYRREKMPNDIQCVKEFDANDYWPNMYRSSYHLTPASNRCLFYATLVRTSFGINFRPFLNME
ncbi:TPA: AAA family ATPase [Aeromonas veronii]